MGLIGSDPRLSDNSAQALRDTTQILCFACHATVTQRRGEQCMTIGSHIEELKRKHATLSRKVEEIQRSPGVSALEIQELKKQKLRLKEEIARLDS